MKTIDLDSVKNLVPLREYCRQKEWPRLSQWHHWIYSRHQIAQKCVKMIGGRYMLNLEAFENYIKAAHLEEE